MIPTDILEAYNELIAQFPMIERKGKTMPYTSVNGHMFSFLDKEGNMGLRLSKEDRESFIHHFNSKLMEQHGRVMKEYVVVPTDLLRNTSKLSDYLKLSYEYVSSLKPKPTKKKK
ncbi:MAG: hypothetical protein MI974_25115 [Chitinophagales bacterium]|nr:hypothetical protein [Chitinophagales bacterium]